MSSEKQPNDLHTPISDKKKILRFTNIFIGIFLLIIGVLSYFAYIGMFNEDDYPLQPLKINETIPINSHTVHLHFISFAFMRTTSLSSHNPIEIKVKLYPNQTELDATNYNWDNLPPLQMMVFDHASVYPRQYNPLSEYPIPAYLILKKYNNPNYYYGNRTIIYESEGKHGYFYFTPEQVNQLYITKTVSVTPNHEQTVELNFSGINIGSSDQTSVARTNNIFVTLTLVLIGFGVVDQRDRLREGFQWVSHAISTLKHWLSLLLFALKNKVHAKNT